MAHACGEVLPTASNQSPNIVSNFMEIPILLMIKKIAVGHNYKHHGLDVAREKCIHGNGSIQSLVNVLCIPNHWLCTPASVSHLQADFFGCQYAYSTTKCAINYSCISRFIFHFSIEIGTSMKIQPWRRSNGFFFWNVR